MVRDVEAYKNTTRDSLQSWALALKQHGITDWMVVLLETPDTRKGNKLLPRTTVLDKIKNDFGSKQPERCVCLTIRIIVLYCIEFPIVTLA